MKELQKEFPDIRESKVRYFEDQGLISPRRDKSGYRRYTQQNMDLLRGILSAQRDDYLPLDVISKRLKTGDIKPKPRSRRKQMFLNPPKEGDAENRKELSLSESDLAKLADVVPKQLAELKEYGILSKRTSYHKGDLEIVQAAKPLLDEGVDPRHLKMFKRTAEQESDLVMQLIDPLLKKIEKAEAYIKLDKLVESSKDLRRALLKREVSHEIEKTN